MASSLRVHGLVKHDLCTRAVEAERDRFQIGERSFDTRVKVRLGEKHEKAPLPGAEELAAEGAVGHSDAVPFVDLSVGDAFGHLTLEAPVFVQHGSDAVQATRLELFFQV